MFIFMISNIVLLKVNLLYGYDFFNYIIGFWVCYILSNLRDFCFKLLNVLFKEKK